MAAHREVHASTRRKTPTTQSSTVNTPTVRGKMTRNASRDADITVQILKPIHPSARQASVSSSGNESERGGKHTSRPNKKASTKAARLTNIDEVEAIDDERATTPPVADIDILFRSPGAVSEMSGTTAITSFTMLEAEVLESRIMLRNLPSLYRFSKEFINHLAPDDGDMVVDSQHIQDMLKPESAFIQDYNYFDSYFSLCVRNYCGDNRRYIHTRPVHAALFGRNHDTEAIQSGVDLVLYLANLVSLAKNMIHSHKTDKDMWRVIRELDHFFPIPFLSRLVPRVSPSVPSAGESALVRETFELALELRTQLAILYLEQRDSFVIQSDPNTVLSEVFFMPDSKADQLPDPPVRG